MDQFRKSAKALETDKRLAPLFVRVEEMTEAEIKKRDSDLPDLSAKVRKVSIEELVTKD